MRGTRPASLSPRSGLALAGITRHLTIVINQRDHRPGSGSTLGGRPARRAAATGSGASEPGWPGRRARRPRPLLRPTCRRHGPWLSQRSAGGRVTPVESRTAGVSGPASARMVL